MIKKVVLNKILEARYPSWDYGYFLEMQKDHLERMYSFFCSDKSHIKDADKVASEIKDAIDILERIIEGDYYLASGDYNDAFTLLTRDLDKYLSILKNKMMGWWD